MPNEWVYKHRLAGDRGHTSRRKLVNGRNHRLSELIQLFHLVGRGEADDEIVGACILVAVDGVDYFSGRAEDAEELFADNIVGDSIISPHELIALVDSVVVIVEIDRDVEATFDLAHVSTYF